MNIFKIPRKTNIPLFSYYDKHLTKTDGSNFINFNKPYQREFVWKSDRQAKLMQAIAKGIDVGSIIWSHNSNTNQEDCIDGKNRSITYRDFFLDKVEIPLEINDKEYTYTFSKLKEASKTDKECEKCLSRITGYDQTFVIYEDLSDDEQAEIFGYANNGEALNKKQIFFGNNFYLKLLCIELKIQLDKFHNLSCHYDNKKCLDMNDILLWLYLSLNDETFDLNLDYNNLLEIKEKDIFDFGKHLNKKIEKLSKELNSREDAIQLFIDCNINNKTILFFNSLSEMKIMTKDEKSGYGWYASLYYSFYIGAKMLFKKDNLQKHKKELNTIWETYKAWVLDRKENEKTYTKLRYPMHKETYEQNTLCLENSYKEIFETKQYLPRTKPNRFQQEYAAERLKANNNICEWCEKIINDNDQTAYDDLIPVGSLRDPKDEVIFRKIHSHCNTERSNNTNLSKNI